MDATLRNLVIQQFAMDIYGNSPFKQLKVNHFMLSCLQYVYYMFTIQTVCTS